jgi:DNA-binding beta-propeller fold protein YncE
MNKGELALLESDLYYPMSLTFLDDGRAYIVDWQNHRVRETTEEGTLRTIIGNGELGDGLLDPLDRSEFSSPGVDALDISLNHPTQIVAQPDGTFTLVAWHNHKLRDYDPDSGLIHVSCGSNPGFGGDGGPAEAALLNQPGQLVVAEDGTQYLLDQRNQIVRRIDTDGIISTVAGMQGQPGFSGDGGPPLEAQFNLPAMSNPPPAGGLALDGDGNLYVSDTNNQRIRKIDFAANVITTVAGTGEADFSGDDGPAYEAALNNPRQLAVGPDGRLYVADQDNHRIRAVDLETAVIETVVGSGEQGFSGDGGSPLEAALDRPAGVAFDREGALYVVDSYNSRVRRIGAAREDD